MFDYCKFFLSLMVAAIHSNLLPNYLYPWLRLAVPMFFIMTGYFLFQKVAAANSLVEKKKCLISFVKRNLKLYLFWFLALLPFTLYIRKWFSRGILLGFMYFLRSLLFSSTFRASWYLMACVIGAILLFFLSQKLSNKMLLGMTGCIYLLVCLWSGYSFLYDECTVIRKIMKAYRTVFTAPNNSFPVALFWMSCGKCFADGDFDRLSAVASTFLRKTTAIAICSVALYAEFRIVCLYGGSLTCDGYIMLAPLAVTAFSCVKSVFVPANARALVLRKSSTILYAMHATVASGISYLLKKCGYHRGEYVFILTVLLCFAVCYVILRMEKTDRFKWLKYSH